MAPTTLSSSQKANFVKRFEGGSHRLAYLIICATSLSRDLSQNVLRHHAASFAGEGTVKLTDLVSNQRLGHSLSC